MQKQITQRLPNTHTHTHNHRWQIHKHYNCTKKNHTWSRWGYGMEAEGCTRQQRWQQLEAHMTAGGSEVSHSLSPSLSSLFFFFFLWMRSLFYNLSFSLSLLFLLLLLIFFSRLQNTLLMFGDTWILHSKFWKTEFYTLKFTSVSKIRPSVSCLLMCPLSATSYCDIC